MTVLAWVKRNDETITLWAVVAVGVVVPVCLTCAIAVAVFVGL